MISLAASRQGVWDKELAFVLCALSTFAAPSARVHVHLSLESRLCPRSLRWAGFILVKVLVINR